RVRRAACPWRCLLWFRHRAGLLSRPVLPCARLRFAVFINSAGKLGTSTSSRRFKEEIKPMDHASEALFSLKPVTFRYKKEIDPTGTSQFGLVAEDVEKINPNLVVRDEKGRVNTVRYDQVNAMLLNEFLQEHRKVQEEEATIAELKKEMEAVV